MSRRIGNDVSACFSPTRRAGGGRRRAAAVQAIAAASWSHSNAAVDTILFNGKIITVDDRFSTAQAVAIRGDRFAAVGTNEQITKLAGPNTRGSIFAAVP